MNNGGYPMINSFSDLDSRFAAIAGKPHAVTRKSAGAVGELFEALMIGGIVGNQKGADFAAIDTEAKVHYAKNPTTIFSFAFTQGMKPSDFSKRFNSGIARAGATNKHGHSVTVKGDMVQVTVNGQAVAGWTIAEIAERIEMKMPNLAMVDATKRGNQVIFNEMFVGKRVVAERFIEAIASGAVVIEMRSGAVQFRAKPATIKEWFETIH